MSETSHLSGNNAEEILEDLANVFFPQLSANLATEQSPGIEIEHDVDARYRTLVEQIPAVVFMAFLDKGISEVYVSPQIEKILGFTADEWLNDPVRWYAQIHPEDRGRWNQEASQVLITGEPLRSTYRVFARDGHIVWLLCEVKLVRRSNGNPWFIHGVAFDLTELKEAERALQNTLETLELHVQERTAELRTANQELELEIAERKRVEQERIQLLIREQIARKEAEEANRAKDEFLATISHELRTPLNVVLGWTRMLRTGKLDKGSMTRALEVIERGAKAQAQLIEDLLDVSSMITGKLRIEFKPVQLLPVIEGVLTSMTPVAQTKGVKLEKDFELDLGPVSGDSQRLEQIVWNLVSNSIKFTPAGGTVTIQLHRIDSKAEIVVSDTGEGISKDFLPYVFDRFRQADSSFTRRHGGLGLGLAIVHHLVEMHRGTVTVSSDGIGKGATFRVLLPLMSLRPETYSEVMEMRRAHDALMERERALDGMRVLIVDDEVDTLEMLTAVLNQFGAQIKSAASASEAFRIFREWKPDVLVSDISMPEEDGFSLIHRVRSLKTVEGGAIPAIALTAHAKLEDRVRVLSSGYQLHIPKPVEPAELIAAIGTLRKRT